MFDPDNARSADGFQNVAVHLPPGGCFVIE
jgi:hypothetical protein